MTDFLTDHFSLAEITNSNTALRLGIDNSLPSTLLGAARSTAQSLERVRTLLGVPIRISSGYRCEALERVLCSKDYISWCAKRKTAADEASWAKYFAAKAHPKARAIDFTAPSFGSPLQIVKKLQASNLSFGQLLMEGTWVHISFDGDRRDVQTVTFDQTGTPIYTQGVA